MVAGERLRYSPSVRRLMGWPGWGAVPGLVRLGMHSCFNTVEAGVCCVFALRSMLNDVDTSRLGEDGETCGR